MPLSNKDDSVEVLSIIPPMELHLHLGAVNKMYDFLDVALKELNIHQTAKDWSDKVGVKRPRLHGGEFNGNQCSQLLENLDWIRNLIEEAGLQECDEIVDIYNAFKCYKKVKSACFGLTLDSNYHSLIKEFGDSYLKLGVPISSKIHAICAHVSQFLDEHGVGQGLGVWSEQASESVHSKFSKRWTSGYKRALTHKDYANQLLNCVVAFNSLNI